MKWAVIYKMKLQMWNEKDRMGENNSPAWNVQDQVNTHLENKSEDTKHNT